MEERVYLTEDPKSITSNEQVKRQSFTVREAKSLGFEDEGYYVYLKGPKEFFEKVDVLNEAKQIEEEKAKKIIKKLKKEEGKGIAGASLLR